MQKQDLALNNQQWMIYPKTKTRLTKSYSTLTNTLTNNIWCHFFFPV